MRLDPTNAARQANVAQAHFLELPQQTQTTDFHPGSLTVHLGAGDEVTHVFSGSNVSGDLFGVMLEYQKVLNKEARDDRRASRDGSHAYALESGTPNRRHPWDE
jgi:hypothetical protein